MESAAIPARRASSSGLPQSSHSHELPYRAIWLRELRAGKHGQRLDLTSTWRLDGLWRATCRQSRVEEAQRLLGSAIDHGAHSTVLAALLRDIDWEREQAHRAYLGDTVHAPTADNAG